MNVTLRLSTEQDRDWLVELRAEVLRDDLERLGRFDADRVRQQMRDGFVPASTCVIVLDGEDVGSVAIRGDEQARWIEYFYLTPTAQNRGVGTRVLKALLSVDDPRPYRTNVLQGSPARHLYERNGFTVDTEDSVDVFMTHHAGAA